MGEVNRKCAAADGECVGNGAYFIYSACLFEPKRRFPRVWSKHSFIVGIINYYVIAIFNCKRIFC